MFYLILTVVFFALVWVILSIKNEEEKAKEEQRIEGLTIHQFAVLVSKKEKGKKEVNIAQIKEILKVINNLLGGELYKMIKQGKKVDVKKNKNCCCI